jgi:hypothetical protein
LRLHEKKLADILATSDETKAGYFKEHNGLMSELESLNNQFIEHQEGLFSLIEKAL